jgi:hypothetical protein
VPVEPSLDAALVEHFQQHGWVLTPPLAPDEVAALSTWVDELADLDDVADGGPLLHHREQTDDGPALCRTENFVPHHPHLGALLTAGFLPAAAGALLGEPALLYKEKVNYKAPGGAGYAPHQDAPAYPFIDRHVSCMVAVDAADEDNGCLEVVSGAHHALLPTDDRGCVAPDVVATLDWVAVPVPAGATLWFHSRTPHRSGPNRTDRPRRALYPTYNAAAEGDLRDAYYAEKLARFAADAAPTGDGNVRVSLIGDFQGRMV